jgi:putative ABC transport system ATP-binding protein
LGLWPVYILHGWPPEKVQWRPWEMNDILSINKVSKIYDKKGQKVNALSEIDLEIQKGDYISLQGPSGSGKTTLLNILGCLDRPTSGKVIIDGEDVSKMKENELSKIRSKQIGFIFQSFNLMPILNAEENVLLPMELTKLSMKDRREKAKALLELVGLKDRMQHRPFELSAGEKQRVAIARALANDPSIILADEPTGNLDSETGRRIMDLLKELNEKTKTTIIVVTHDDKMAKLTKKILNIKDGRIDKERKIEETLSETTDKMESICPNCANALQSSWKVCPYCETKIDT